MSESIAQSLADSYWFEVRKWAMKHPGKNPFASGHVFGWLEAEAQKAGVPETGIWCVIDVVRRAEEILKERVKNMCPLTSEPHRAVGGGDYGSSEAGTICGDCGKDLNE